MDPPGLLWWALNPMGGMRVKAKEIREMGGHTGTQERGHVQKRQRWEMWPQAKECQEPPEAGRGKEGVFPGDFGGSVALSAS